MIDPFSALRRRRLRHEAALVGVEAARLRELEAAALANARETTRAALRRGRVNPGGEAAMTSALAHLAILAGRALDLSPRPLQFQAALAMFQGRVVWMPAGTGKSLAIALAAALHAWSGRPCRVAMATTALARRDSERFAPFYQACGLRVACVTEEMAAEQAVLMQAYAAEVVYASARQSMADSLREQIMRGAVDDPLRMRLRGFAVGAGEISPRRGAMLVDDADLVLNDDAGAPLIISTPGDNPLLLDALRAAREAVAVLQAGRDYEYVPERRDIRFTVAGETLLDDLGDHLPGIWQEPERRDDLLRQALGVRDLLLKGRHYRVAEGKVVVLDDGIGRILGVRSWSQGLVQAIEAREGLEFTMPARTLARMSYPAFFRRHAHLGGVGRGYRGIEAILHDAYRMRCLRLADADAPASPQLRVFLDRDEKLDGLAAEVIRLHAGRHPVLIVSRRMGDSEALRDRLAAASVQCELFDSRTLDVADMERLADPGRVSLVQSSVLQGVTLSPPVRASLHCLLAEPHDLAHADQRIATLVDRRGLCFLALDDDLLLQHLPRSSAWLRGRADGRRWLPLLRRMAQRLAMRGMRKQGKLLLKRDALLNQQLAFTGEQDIDLGIYAFGNPAKD